MGKSYKVKPKSKHKEVLNNMLENGGNAYQAILEAGYSEKVAENPKRVLDTKGFRMLLAEEIPDNEIIRAIKDGIYATKHTLTGEEVSDFATRHKYIETALKIQGRIEKNPETNNTFIFVAPEQQKRIAARVIDMQPLPAPNTDTQNNVDN